MKYSINDIDNKHPFKVPEGYFDELNKTILEKTSSTPKSRVLQPRLQWAVVSFIIILGVGAWVLFGPSNVEPSASDYLAEVSNEDIIEYLSFYDLSEDDILPDQLELIEFESPVELIDKLEIDETDVEDLYLLLYDMTTEPS